MVDVDVNEEDFSEAGEAGEGLVKRNPLGVYYGHRNDKNERHGRGRSELPNGDLYLGCFYRGQRHGLGIYRYKNGNGARYGGDWTFGDKKGWGTMYYPDGAQYTGNWDRNLRHGWGVYVFPNGDEYEGWWYYGRRNGRGIYRTKANGEKFIGEWRLGKRHGPGMLIRKHHKFIGHWYNDAPRGPGVYVFPELGCEQHGRYTHMKCAPGGEDRWRLAGYQVRSIRGTPPFPLDDPHAIEKQHQSVIEMRGEFDGEGTLDDLNAQAKASKPSVEQKVFNYMLHILEQDEAADQDRVFVVPMWRAIQITGLVTPIPDDTVPPPPLPETPKPPPEPEPEAATTEAEANEEIKGEGEEDPILEARRLAQTHALQATYYGHGVCQPDTVEVKIPPEVEPYSKFSTMSLSNMDEMRAEVEATGGQLEPLDIEAAMRENQARVASGQGLNVAESWRTCLADDGTCEFPDAPPPPGGHEGGHQHAGGAPARQPQRQSQSGRPTHPGGHEPGTSETEPQETSANDEEGDASEPYNLMTTETEDEEEEAYTTDDY